MILAEKRCRLPFSLAEKFRPRAFHLCLLCSAFEEKLAQRLKLLRSSRTTPGLTLTWLSLAVKTLSSIHADARAIVADLNPSDLVMLPDLYLDGSIKILDVCNSVAAEISRRQQQRLLINYALRLIDGFPRDGEKVRRAAVSLRDLDNSPTDVGARMRTVLILRDLSERSRKASRLRSSFARKVLLQTIYAANAVSVLVAGVLVESLFNVPEGAERIRVPAEFAWAEAFNELRREIDGRRRVEEFERVDLGTARLAGALDDVACIGETGGDDGRWERMRESAKEVEKATETLSVGLDRISNELNGFFGVVLSTRNAVLDRFRQ